jgi:hypothetical protein
MFDGHAALREYVSAEGSDELATLEMSCQRTGGSHSAV